MSPAEQLELPDLTPLIGLGLKLVLVALAAFVIVGLARSWWHNRSVAAPPAARGGRVEPIARVLRGASTTWDQEMLTAGLFVKRDGRLYRPGIAAASRSQLRVVPLPGTMPRWLHPATVAHLAQIADHPVQIGQLGKCVVIQAG